MVERIAFAFNVNFWIEILKIGCRVSSSELWMSKTCNIAKDMLAMPFGRKSGFFKSFFSCLRQQVTLDLLVSFFVSRQTGKFVEYWLN
jgi:hypothetical protein